MSKRTHKTKQLFSIKIDDCDIRINCIYNLKSGKVRIDNSRKSYYVHTKREIERSRKYVSVCTILKQHAEDLKDDPERLSTAFIQKMIYQRGYTKDDRYR